MACYEMVREIKNLCRNNQMRDVFFEEIECSDPAEYVRQVLKGREVEVTAVGTDGNITVHAVCDGLMQSFTFTKLS